MEECPSQPSAFSYTTFYSNWEGLAKASQSSSSLHATSSICMNSLISVSHIQVSPLSSSEQIGTSKPLPPELVPSSGFITVTACSVKIIFAKFFFYQIKTPFAQRMFSWGSLSVRVASTPKLASFLALALALVLAPSLTLSRSVLCLLLPLSR